MCEISNIPPSILKCYFSSETFLQYWPLVQGLGHARLTYISAHQFLFQYRLPQPRLCKISIVRLIMWEIRIYD